MESLGAFANGECNFFGKIFATEEHDEYTPQFLGQSSILLGDDDGGLNIGLIQSTFSSENEHMFCSLDADHNSNLQYISQESSYSTSNCSEDTNVFIANDQGLTTNYYYSHLDHHVLVNNDASISMDFCMDEKNLASFVPSLSDIVMKESVNHFNEDVGSDRLENSDHTQMEPMVSPTKQLHLKRKLELPEEVPAEDETNKRSKNQKKKPWVSNDVQGCMKNARSRKNQKVARNGNEAEETNYAGSDGQSSRGNISEDDNASQENSIGGATSVSQSALNSNGKPRASRGSATDPQSLYAKKRRERINERLRILQNLVPNGTKVDISTMLEEAVNYVKFLQLQIKLLSSDDLWMYAPLAYNGLDIGLNLNMKNSSPLL